MAGRSTWMSSALTQTALYWATPVPDGFGGYTYDAPVEIDCRWEEKQEIFVDAMGREKRSKAVVYLAQDVDYQGLLFLGDLDDLTSAEEADPVSVDGTHEVQAFAKNPRLDGGDFERIAWL